MMTFAQTVASIYIRGNWLETKGDGSRAFRVAGEELPLSLAEAVKEHKDAILEMLFGDPLSGPGWVGRSEVTREALRWLDRKLEDMGITSKTTRVARVLDSEAELEKFNTAWVDGDFEEFRDALRAYIGTGLAAARRQQQAPTQGGLELSA